MNTFDKQITIYSKEMVDGEFKTVPVSKTATFQELEATNQKQHKLHFKLMSLVHEASNDTSKLVLDTNVLYDLTVDFIKTSLIVNDTFSEQNKVELLADSRSILSFALWMSKEKFTPFFVLLMGNSSN